MRKFTFEWGERTRFFGKLVGLCCAQLLVLALCARMLYGYWPGQDWFILLCVALVQLAACGLMLRGIRMLVGWRKRSSQRVSPEIKAERTRIAQDLHDGVGSHLYQALSLLDESPKNVEPARVCISHAMWALRGEMEVLDDVDGNLIERLATMRWRLEPLLQSKKIRISWTMPTDNWEKAPRGEMARQLVMVAQEAISNALRHAQCQHLSVSLMCEGMRWQLKVSDDGCGLTLPAQSMPASSQHRGLRNMASRAKATGALLHVQSAPGKGCTISVSWTHNSSKPRGMEKETSHAGNALA